MQYKKIKDLNASAIGFGCWAMGGTWNNVDDDESIRTVHAAIDRGINFFDVAPVYGLGHSEIMLGRALKTQDRSKLIIASKCGLPWNAEKQVRNDLSAASIERELEESLKRLGTDYLDLLQVHWPDPNTPLEQTGDALAKIWASGKVRHIGVCNYSLGDVEILQEYVDIASFQGLYNLLEQDPTHYHNIELDYRSRSKVLPFCAENDMKYLPYSPLMQGLLGGDFNASNNFDQNDDRFNNPKLNGDDFTPYFKCAQQLKALAEQHQVPLAHLAIQWLVAQADVGPVIAGAHRVSHAVSNAESLDTMLSSTVLDQAQAIVIAADLA
ncbi:aldo/keto reductase [Alginatibacterium sediminis]|uniref:Aldo/keto reductase n=1 Tax=Alginatibacterium sediminis TaxID=2164068 RepID=A0A420EDK7_9ALTE|nr:aldo/keto reductase [Alginatibacterium sediminis]RKF18787.1 aldo/keto reductase [Alginatibacterium sediminis]